MELTIPHFAYLAAAGDAEDTFWIQLLMIVTLAAGGGIFALAKSRAKRFRRKADDEIIENLVSNPHRTSFGPRRVAGVSPASDSALEGRRPKAERRNLKSGMELLEGPFLVEVVENIGALGALDVVMRRLAFLELIRRNGLGAVSSDALKAYTLDEGGFFDKSIRREAMVQLADRTVIND